MNKNKILTIAITAVSTALLTWVGAGGCEGPGQPHVVTQTRIERDTVYMPGGTVRLPARIVEVPVAVVPDSLVESYEAQLASAREQYEDALMRLSYFESLSAVADTTVRRELVLICSMVATT